MMQIILSVAVSLDGYIDDCSSERLKLSSDSDFYDVHALRADCDAVMVGAETIRKDNPSLITKHAELLALRRQAGLADDPIKITVSRFLNLDSGNLDSGSRFFQRGGNEKWVLCPALPSAEVRSRFADDVKFYPFEPDNVASIIALLESLNIKKLLVEGGSSLLTQFLQSGLAHHLRLAVAPFFVGDSSAPRFVKGGEFIHCKDRRMRLLQTRILGDMAVLDYDLQNG